MKTEAQQTKKSNRRLFRRPPDFIIGSPSDPYLLRWWIIPRNRYFNVYLHKFLRDDDDRALHDHPWVSLSVILRGGYIEHLPGGLRKKRRVGQMVFRRAKQAHRIQMWLDWSKPIIPPGDRLACFARKPAWSLFITGPRIREWGFHCPRGRWVHWKDFTSPDSSAEVGRGRD